MATTVGALSVDLDLNSANFINNMKRAVDGVEKSSKSMASSLNFASNATKAFIAGFTADKIGETIAKGLEFASSLGEQAQQLGVTTRELQVYRYAASQVGLSNEQMDQGLAKLTLRIGQAASGNQKLAGVFSSLGIAIADSSGQARQTGDVMEDLAAKLSKVEDPARRAQIEVALFGKAGQNLDTLLSGGAAGIDELTRSADQLGIVLSEDMIRRADDAADKMSAVKQVLEAKIAATVAQNADAIMMLANSFVAVVDWAGKAANAYRRFKMEQGVVEARAAQTGIASWFNSDADKAQAAKNEAMFRRELYKMDHPNSTMFGLPAGLRNPSMPTIADDTPSAARGGLSRRSGGGRSTAKTLDDEFAALERSLDPAKAANQEFEKNIALLRRAADQGKITAARYSELHDAMFKDWQREGNTAMEKAPLALDRLGQSIRLALPDISQLQVELQKVPSAMDEAFSDAKMAGMDAFIGSIENLRRGFGSLKDVALNVLDAIQGAILNKLVYGPLMDWAEGKSTGGGGGGVLGGLFSAIGSIFGGKRALGGSVSAGRVYRVGEQGEELFSPGTSGTIIPNAAMNSAGNGGGGGNTYHISGNLLTPEFWDQIQAMDMASARAGSDLAMQRISQKNARRLG